MTVSRSLVALGLLTAFTACNSTGVGNPPSPELSKQESELIADGDDGNRAGDGASSLVAIPLWAFKTPEQLATSDGAAAVGEWSRLAFQPSTCVTGSRAANVVTWQFADCQGPFGLAQLSGKLTATYVSRGPSNLEVVIKSEGLRLASPDGVSLVRGDVSIDATAILSITAGGVHQVTWNGRYTAVLGAKTIDHQPAYEMTRGECLQLTGTSTTTVTDARGKRGVTTSLTGYARCGDRRTCPKSGTLTIDASPGPFSLTIDFLGGQAIEITSTARPEPLTLAKGLRCIP